MAGRDDLATDLANDPAGDLLALLLRIGLEHLDILPDHGGGGFI